MILKKGNGLDFSKTEDMQPCDIIQGFVTTEQNEKQDQHANELPFLRQYLWKSG